MGLDSFGNFGVLGTFLVPLGEVFQAAVHMDPTTWETACDSVFAVKIGSS